VLNEKAAAAEAILDRAGLSIELLDETPEDAQRAKLIDFGPDYEQKILHAHSKPLFEKEQEDRRHIVSSASQKGKLKSQQAVEKTKENLQKDLMRNTRAAIDPFLGQHDRPRPGLGIKILEMQWNLRSPISFETLRYCKSPLSIRCQENRRALSHR
jgi:coiled-coil domain-containing protein 130